MAIATGNSVAEALETAKAQLVEQQQQVETQLEQIRKGIDSIEGTLALFAGSSLSQGATAVKTESKPASRAATTVSKSASKPAKSNPRASKQASKRKGQANWSSYLRSEFKGQSIGEMIQIAGRRLGDQPFSTSDLMDEIFESNIPKDDRAAARNRILNALSLGTANGKYMRHGTGTYTLNAASSNA